MGGDRNVRTFGRSSIPMTIGHDAIQDGLCADIDCFRQHHLFRPVRQRLEEWSRSFATQNGLRSRSKLV